MSLRGGAEVRRPRFGGQSGHSLVQGHDLLVLRTQASQADLPVLGFGRDTKVGFGLWRNGPAAFAVEYLMVVAATLAFEPPNKWLWILVAAALFHAININSFFGFSKTNPIGSARGYAAVAWVGFVAMVAVFNFLI